MWQNTCLGGSRDRAALPSGTDGRLTESSEDTTNNAQPLPSCWRKTCKTNSGRPDWLPVRHGGASFCSLGGAPQSRFAAAAVSIRRNLVSLTKSLTSRALSLALVDIVSAATECLFWESHLSEKRGDPSASKTSSIWVTRLAHDEHGVSSSFSPSEAPPSMLAGTRVAFQGILGRFGMAKGTLDLHCTWPS